MQRISIICNNPSWHPYWDRGENRTVPKIPRGIGYKIRNGCSDLVHGPTRACPAPLRKAGAPGHAWDTHPHPHTPPGQQQHPPAGPRCPHGRRDRTGREKRDRGGGSRPHRPTRDRPAPADGDTDQTSSSSFSLPFCFALFFPSLVFLDAPPNPSPQAEALREAGAAPSCPAGVN